MGKVADVFKYADKICKRFVSPGAFLVAGNGEDSNVMTIGWGFVGYAWQKPVCVVLVRDSRHTQRLMEEHGEFTVCLPFSGMERNLGKAGSLSGRDGDKWTRCGLQKAAAKTVSTPIVAMEDGLVLECRKLTGTDLKGDCVDPSIMQAIYSDNDMHKLYYGEILEVY